jgi:peptide/nickel transport system substrate-binding protein
LYQDLLAGRCDRRSFVERAIALGVGASGALALANTAAAQEATPAASPVASPAATPATPVAGMQRPAVGTETQVRGEGGELRLLVWQAPTHLSPHTASGVKDTLAGTIVLEPLVHYLPDTSMYPNLVQRIPTIENGLLAPDLTSVTYELLPGVTWSDGQPLTADDVVFTWQWIANPENSATSIGNYESIASVEAIDALTVKITFVGPNPVWAIPFVGSTSGHVYPKHVLGDGGVSIDAFQVAPIGTGPFRVESFTPNDGGTYVLNENYREPTKPWFSRIVLKGGGDAASAARAVIQTGEFDYAWNLAVEPEILQSMLSDDSPGTYVVGTGGSVEMIYLNFSDPETEVDGQRSEMNTPNPKLSDPAVRQALVAAIDREMISNQFYLGMEQEPAVANVISGIPGIDSPDTTLGFDPERARQLLDEAGWVLDGDTRSKDGVELSLTYATSISQIRQKIQAVVKSNLEAIGVKVELVQVDAGIFFDSAEGNDQNYPHFYRDIEMFTSPYAATRPINSLLIWYAGPDGANISQKSNAWSARNFTRYRNAEFDAVHEACRTETDAEAFANAFIQMNDMLYNDAATIPLVRAVGKTGLSKQLNQANVSPSQFNYDTWNIANWNHAPNE